MEVKTTTDAASTAIPAATPVVTEPVVDATATPAIEAEQPTGTPAEAPAPGDAAPAAVTDGQPAAAAEGDDDPEPDGTDPAAWSAWRDRESNRLALQRVLAETEVALGTPAEPAAPAQPATPAVPAVPAQAVAVVDGPISARFEAVKAAVAEAVVGHEWPDGEKGYVPTPGETMLLDFVGELVAQQEQLQTVVDQVYTTTQTQHVRTILGYADAAAKSFKEAYGIAVTGPQLAGLAENGGALAWATAKGIDPNEVLFHLTAEAFVEIAEIKMGSQLRKVRGAAPAAPAVPKATLPDVNRGGGGNSDPNKPMTNADIVREALAEARALKGGGN